MDVLCLEPDGSIDYLAEDNLVWNFDEEIFGMEKKAEGRKTSGEKSQVTFDKKNFFCVFRGEGLLSDR